MFLKENQTKHLHPVKVPIKKQRKNKASFRSFIVVTSVLQKSNVKTSVEDRRKLICVEYWKCNESCSVVSDSLRPHGWYSPCQARILEWVTFPFSRGSSQSRDRTQVSRIAGGFFTSWATREALVKGRLLTKVLKWDKIFLVRGIQRVKKIQFEGGSLHCWIWRWKGPHSKDLSGLSELRGNPYS